MAKRLFVINDVDSDRFVVCEEEGDYAIGDVYEVGQVVESEIVLPEDADRLEGLMGIEEVESLILQAVEAAYSQGRIDEQRRIEARLRRSFLGE